MADDAFLLIEQAGLWEYNISSHIKFIQPAYNKGAGPSY
jgi:hypothetical protein